MVENVRKLSLPERQNSGRNHDQVASWLRLLLPLTGWRIRSVAQNSHLLQPGHRQCCHQRKTGFSLFSTVQSGAQCIWMVKPKLYLELWGQRGLKIYYALLAPVIKVLTQNGLELGAKNHQQSTTQSIPLLLSIHSLFLSIFNFVNGKKKPHHDSVLKSSHSMDGSKHNQYNPPRGDRYSDITLRISGWCVYSTPHLDLVTYKIKGKVLITTFTKQQESRKCRKIPIWRKRQNGRRMAERGPRYSRNSAGEKLWRSSLALGDVSRSTLVLLYGRKILVWCSTCSWFSPRSLFLTH